MKGFCLARIRGIKKILSENAGPDYSIWRKGPSPRATWIIFQPVSGKAVLYLRPANPREEVRENRYFLEDLFSGEKTFQRIVSKVNRIIYLGTRTGAMRAAKP
jgi:hypothetical protein